jgi:hypothetical protein
MDCRKQLEGKIEECFGLITGSDGTRSLLRSGDKQQQETLADYKPRCPLGMPASRLVLFGRKMVAAALPAKGDIVGECIGCPHTVVRGGVVGIR